MPLYNVKCTNKECDYEDDMFLSVEEQPPKCPKCEKQLVRCIGATRFTLDGYHLK